MYFIKKNSTVVEWIFMNFNFFSYYTIWTSTLLETSDFDPGKIINV
jgi:hypothetical protein